MEVKPRANKGITRKEAHGVGKEGEREQQHNKTDKTSEQTDRQIDDRVKEAQTETQEKRKQGSDGYIEPDRGREEKGK